MWCITNTQSTQGSPKVDRIMHNEPNLLCTEVNRMLIHVYSFVFNSFILSDNHMPLCYDSKIHEICVLHKWQYLVKHNKPKLIFKIGKTIKIKKVLKIVFIFTYQGLSNFLLHFPECRSFPLHQVNNIVYIFFSLLIKVCAVVYTLVCTKSISSYKYNI